MSTIISVLTFLSLWENRAGLCKMCSEALLSGAAEPHVLLQARAVILPGIHNILTSYGRSKAQSEMYSSGSSSLSFTLEARVIYSMFISWTDLPERMFLTIHTQSRPQKYNCAVWISLCLDIDKAHPVGTETTRWGWYIQCISKNKTCYTWGKPLWEISGTKWWKY